MPIKYKVDVLAALKGAGISTYKLRQERLLGQSTIAQLRRGEMVSWATLERLCEWLGCQPGQLLEYDGEEVEDVRQAGLQQQCGVVRANGR